MKQYISRAEAIEDFGLSETGLRRILDELRGFSGVGKRYGPYAIRGQGKYLQVRYAVLTDFMSYRERLNNKDSRKYVPDFNIREAERDLGVTSDVFITRELNIDAEQLAGAIVRELASKIIAG